VTANPAPTDREIAGVVVGFVTLRGDDAETDVTVPEPPDAVSVPPESVRPEPTVIADGVVPLKPTNLSVPLMPVEFHVPDVLVYPNALAVAGPA
jgi:hypothetical protein